MPLYFIAVLLPKELNELIMQDKLWMKDNFGCEVALRSPAHITLVPPFHLPKENEESIANDLKDFCQSWSPFEVLLSDYGYFAPRVIYVDVAPSPGLLKLKAGLQDFLISAGHKIKTDDRPFHPHITIANRDLERKDFYKAKQYFDNKNFEAAFTANNISLLRSEPAGWVVARSASFI